MRSSDADNSGRTLALLALVLAAVMFVFPLAIGFPLLDPDEGLHASIARDMVERSDWITPRFLGRPFLDKPILYFSAQAASLWLFGPSETAVRLPGLMFGLLGAISTGLLGWRMFNRATGLIAGILYATTILPTALAQAASHDVALIPWINLTLLLLWEVAQPPSAVEIAPHSRGRLCYRPGFWIASMCLLGAGVFLGLAILTKGLFGVAVVGLAYGGYLLITRRFSLAILLGGLAVLVVAVLVASPWYVAVAVQNPDYLNYYFIERHVLAFVTDSQPHGDQPWWYYFAVLLGGGLPWIAYLPIVVREGLARRRNSWISAGKGTTVGAAVVLPHPERGGSATATPTLLPLTSGAMPLLWTWLIGWTLLMMLAGSKLATYLWPVFPPIAILAATAWAGLIDGTLSPAARRSFARTFVFSSWSGPIVLPAAVLAVQVAFAVQFAWPVWLAVSIAAVVSLLPLVPWRAGRWQASLAAAALSVAVQFVVVVAILLPQVAETCSARELARHFNRLGRVPPRLLVTGWRIGSLMFYLDPRLRAGLGADQIRQLPANELPHLRPGDVIAVPEWKVPKLRPYFDVDHNQYESVGPYRLYRVTSR